MLRIFSCTCWPSVCLFGGNVYSQPLLIFKSGCLFIFDVELYVKVTQLVVSDSLRPHAQEIVQARILEWVAVPFSRDLPNLEIEPRSPTLQVDSLPTEPPGKPEKTGVGSLSLLQQIFLTQGLNQGLLHCKRILYPLSYQGNPNVSSMSAHLRQQDAHSTHSSHAL